MTRFVIALLLALVIGLLFLTATPQEDDVAPAQGPTIDPVFDVEPPPFEYQDTEFFIYHKPTGPNEPYEGTQSNGTMHKVGLASDVNANFPQIAAAVSQMIATSENADRDTFLVNSGYVPKLSIRYWFVNIFDETENGQGQIELLVRCHAGSEACGACVDGILEEQWLLSNGQLSLASRQFVDGFRAVGPFSLDGT